MVWLPVTSPNDTAMWYNWPITHCAGDRAMTTRTTHRFLIAILALAALIAGAAAWAADGAPQPLELTILHTNDIHGHLFPFDYDALGRTETNVGGAARRACLIRQIKRSAGNPVLVMDAGDVFTRGPLPEAEGVPDFDVLNAVPYDVMTLGNNEFKGASGEEGLRILHDRVKQARFAVLSANVTDKSSDKTIVAPWKVFDVEGVRIGVFGLTAPRVASYDQAKTLNVEDPIQTAKRVVPELLKEADFIVALTHIGYPLDLQLATEVPEIDVIIGGDSHTWVFEPTLVRSGRTGMPAWWIGGIPVCQDGEWGKCVGRLDLSLRQTAGTRRAVASYSGKLVPVDSSVAEAKDVQRIVADCAKPYERKVGTLAEPVPKSEAPAWVAEVMRKAAKAQVAVEPNYCVENGLPLGPVTELDVRKMFPFTNHLVKLTVTGKQLLGFIGEFDSGLAGIEPKDSTYLVDGRPIDTSATYTLAVEDYFAATSPSLKGAKPEPIGLTTRRAVIEFLVR